MPDRSENYTPKTDVRKHLNIERKCRTSKYSVFEKTSVATVSKNFKISLEGQNYVHFDVILSRNVKYIWYNGITTADR